MKPLLVLGSSIGVADVTRWKLSVLVAVCLTSCDLGNLDLTDTPKVGVQAESFMVLLKS
jgi:hypothetical protein